MKCEAVCDKKDEESSKIVCEIKGPDEHKEPIHGYTAYYGHMVNVTNCFAESGCEGSTWNKEKYVNTFFYKKLDPLRTLFTKLSQKLP